ncbi:hypothetical protein BKA00_006766 [Actinomadura coerulea]|uniref:Uncharacterized protein n=1 Tax=Actinomadura coerulea TaxID=46159 RepID=A0A7X0G5N3_9ACTN|nr:hypothetical protein [Actinomadura coerulea]MBB6399852.1 hypothetical protein [Actinomadura coerulea]GGQ16490.1 hypothetical protein GCM10010187_35870 [Actinomadura coerulea]
MGDTHDAKTWNTGVDMITSSDQQVRDAGFKALELAENNTDGTHPGGGTKPQGGTSQS